MKLKLAKITIERKILLGTLASFLLLYIILFSNHFYQCMYKLYTFQKEILQLPNTREVGILFLSTILLGVALLCRSYQKKIELIKTKDEDLSGIKSFQERRFNLLKEFIKYSDESKTFNPHFLKGDFLKRLNMEEGEFNIIQKSLGDKYCHIKDILNGKSRYEIHTDNCLSLYEQIEQYELSKMQNKSGDKLYSLSIIMVFIAFIQAIIGILQINNK